LICPSTLAFWDEAQRTSEYSFFDFLHGYFYNRWPYLYISVAAGEHRLNRLIRPISRLFRRLSASNSNHAEKRNHSADRYHAKVVTTEGARQLVMVNEDVRLENLEKIIPYRQARDIILMNPDHIVAVECPCRSAREHACSPLDVCLVVGEPFAGFIAAHHPHRSRWIDSNEACDILAAEHKRGHVHHAFFNDVNLNRFFGICNCCSCCCVAMQAFRNGTPMLAPSGYSCNIVDEQCNGCGICVEMCPFGVIKVSDVSVKVNSVECMGCGVCASVCEYDAVSLVRDPTKGEPLEIFNLMNHTE
jgi:ferredoxin